MKFKTEPFPHQLQELERTRDLTGWAFFLEMGLGKSKLVIDTAAHLLDKGEVDALLVVAPNGVHQSWILDALPEHAPFEYRAFAWKTSKARNKSHVAEFKLLFETTKMPVLTMSYDGLMTELGSKAAKEFLTKRRCLYVLDESQKIKTPGRKRTIRALASGKYAAYRRVLNGTPVTNSPFDVYTQLKFLQPDFWALNGFASLEAFQTFFGVFEQRLNHDTGQRFQTVVGYRNLPVLQGLLAKLSTRLIKAEVLTLPPKVYSKRRFLLSKEQLDVYKKLKDELFVQLDSGQLTTAPLAITCLLRFQQITSGYLPGDEEGEVHRFQGNPRLVCMYELNEETTGQGIVYARFRQEIDDLVGLLPNAVRYDGKCGPEERREAVERFQRGDAKWFVGNPAACGVGLTLHAASTVVYYSNSYSLEQRLQSEDRAHRIGQTKSVSYVDFAGTDEDGTKFIDDKIIDALRQNRNVAGMVTGDAAREWI